MKLDSNYILEIKTSYSLKIKLTELKINPSPIGYDGSLSFFDSTEFDLDNVFKHVLSPKSDIKIFNESHLFKDIFFKEIIIEKSATNYLICANVESMSIERVPLTSSYMSLINLNFFARERLSMDEISYYQHQDIFGHINTGYY